jgi:predicted RNA binding protein YcfA (HicA-like mRNA interferase family)
MGRLAGLKYRKIVTLLKTFGFEFYRQAAGSHEIWYNPQTNRFTTVPNHTGDMPEGTLRAILKQAGIDTNDFINSI